MSANNNQLQDWGDEYYRELYPETNWASPELAFYQHIPLFEQIHPSEDSYERFKRLLEQSEAVQELNFSPDVIESARQTTWNKIQDKKTSQNG